ncbi:heavy-metal-associated domain-containing protein [Gluconobacter morbifer]|uniref:HMA domain-containing protein n=1 Tax=Gluconobacter morbifer G707 TaxID=1088869 RepID=G6XKH6_9PROT|nr:heavy metal-associated domain-containing protein [Gluconobacter morbifer]EHH67772.1 hypothetical protein GMO_19920 [Gluconobacter morbifer G707]
MASTTFRIQGMSCTGCSSRLQKALEGVEGVEDAEVTLEPPQAVIQYDDMRVSPTQLQETVEEVGFDVV